MNARLPDPTPLLDPVAVRQRVDARWQHDILPALQRYIEVPDARDRASATPRRQPAHAGAAVRGARARWR
jgi:hypothetical protein